MLDRKTKDIDADVELLEDRIEHEKIIIWFWAIMSLILVCMGAIIQTIKSVPIGTAIALIAIVPLTFAFINCNYKKSMEILLYLKRQFEKRKR